MMILTAEYESSHERQTWEIDSDHSIILGRSVDNDCCVPWDPLVSRQHAELVVRGALLSVRCLPGVPLPISVGGRSLMVANFANGESFRIGKTVFTVASSRERFPASETIDDVPRQTRNLGFPGPNSTDGRLSSVSNNASPLNLAADEEELAERGLQILRQVLRSADVIAVVKCREGESGIQPKIVRSDTAAGQFQPLFSLGLIRRTISLARSTVRPNTVNLKGQTVAGGQWAFCVPLKNPSTWEHCIYVAGRFPEEPDQTPSQRSLGSKVHMAELVAHLMEKVYQSLLFKKQIEGIRHFLPPSLLKTIAHSGSKSVDLRPQETDVVVIYCDLRGSSRMVATVEGDLPKLLQRVSAALGIITRSIMDHQGVISDFQGDSALGFWGWPSALNDGAISACRAALQIRRIFDLLTRRADGELNGFHVGIGVASGRAIAGRIGPLDHSKIGVFGPVVNLASRLEGFTRQTGATILLDNETAQVALNSTGSDNFRCRPMGAFQPAGLDGPVDIHELLPSELECAISTSDIETFHRAVLAFRRGEWKQSCDLLTLVPKNDAPRDFLIRQMELRDCNPPANWSGVITPEFR